MTDLGTLRKKISDIDSKIIELLTERANIAAAVGAVKSGSGIPLRNADVETEVLERYLKVAERSSFPRDAAERICRAIISGSVEIQSSILRGRCEKNVAIVGGNGSMGKWMQRYFKSLGSGVSIVDVSVGSMDDIRDSDIIVISVPISSIKGVLKDVDRLCKDDALIFDIASVKSPFVRQLRNMAKKRRVCSVHPMFGPSAASMVERNVMICDCGNADAVAEAKRIFSNDGVIPLVTAVERHDVLMAYTLSLAHAANIAFFTSLKNSGMSADELKGAGSTTFLNTLRTSVPVSRENASLYHEIQRMNDNAEDMWDVYERSVREVRDAALSEDKEAFVRIMDEGKKYLTDCHL